MKLINSSFEILEQKHGLQGIYEQIELGARTCYKSEGLIKYDEQGNSLTAKDFVDKIVNVYKHRSVAEHGTVYLYQHFDNGFRSVSGEAYQRYVHNPYSKVNYQFEKKVDGAHDYYITTNYRVLIENGWLDNLKYLCEPTEYHKKRVSVRFICDRGVSHELVRHRVFSFAQESTRYCNYSKDKFGNELTFIVPSWLDELELQRYGAYHTQIRSNHPEEVFVASANIAEIAYKNLIHNGWTPQQARQVLPNAIKTELVMTGYVSDWEHFFSLRCAENAHPDIRKLAIPLKEEFIKRGYAL